MPLSHYKLYSIFVDTMNTVRTEYVSTVQNILIARKYTNVDAKKDIRKLQEEFVKKARLTIASFLADIIRETLGTRCIATAETAELWATDISYKYPMESEENFLPLPVFDGKVQAKMQYKKDKSAVSLANIVSKEIHKLCFPRTKSKYNEYSCEDFSWLSMFDSIHFMCFRDSEKKITGFVIFDFTMMHDFEEEDECEVLVSFLKIGEISKIKMVDNDYNIVEESILIDDNIRSGHDFAKFLDYLGIGEKFLGNLEFFGINGGSLSDRLVCLESFDFDTLML